MKAGPDVAARVRVLLAEDNDGVARSILRLLGPGFQVTRAVDGMAARTLLESGASFDVVLSDVSMPRMDGFGLLRWLRAVRPELAERTVFMTADLDQPSAREIAATHLHAVLQKPVERGVLRRTLRTLAGIDS